MPLVRPRIKEIASKRALLASGQIFCDRAKRTHPQKIKPNQTFPQVCECSTKPPIIRAMPFGEVDWSCISMVLDYKDLIPTQVTKAQNKVHKDF